MTNKRRAPITGLVLTLLLALAGCGQTGPLVLPGAQPAAGDPALQTPAEEGDEDEDEQ